MERGGKIADCGDLAYLSDQSKQSILLWSNRIWLLLTPACLTNKCIHTNLRNPSWSSKLAHKHAFSQKLLPRQKN